MMKFFKAGMVLIASVVIQDRVVAVEQTQENARQWYQQGRQQISIVKEHVRQASAVSTAKAKNIILFIGDGMGVSTVTAARIHAGQLLGKKGEEHQLFFETLPYLALAKTYNTNQQTPDSAGTMTAIMTGMKTKAGFISVAQSMMRGDCRGLHGNILTTAIEHADQIGMSTGIVTTTRLTHATPAVAYAHVPERNFEDDADAKLMQHTKGCVDIAQQLLAFGQHFGDGLEVALGGGRRNFIPRQKSADASTKTSGERLDGRNLINEWLQQHQQSSYVRNRAQLAAVDPLQTKHLLGLFSASHMDYELDRHNKKLDQPSLTEMTAKGIAVLQKNPKGYLLLVESGRIDHAHHAGNAQRALHETIEFDSAVRKAYSMTNAHETLIIVTADHSHVFTIAGYPTRGNPILGKVVHNDWRGLAKSRPELALDGLPYTTLGYANGLGFAADKKQAAKRKSNKLKSNSRVDLADIDTQTSGYHQEALVPLHAETHSAEDVAVYASGPGSSLFQGTIEQHVIFHILDMAGRLSERSGIAEVR